MGVEYTLVVKYYLIPIFTTMAEYLTQEDANGKYASKGKGNAGLTLGIIGTALGALAFGHRGFGSGVPAAATIAAEQAVGAMPTAYEIEQKLCANNIELTKGIYETRITDLKEKFDLYTMLGARIGELEKSQATTNAQLPLMFQLANCHSERYTDNKVHNAESVQTAINFGFQRELDTRIKGTLGLPMSDLITCVPTLPNLNYVVTGCNSGHYPQ